MESQKAVADNPADKPAPAKGGAADSPPAGGRGKSAEGAKTEPGEAKQRYVVPYRGKKVELDLSEAELTDMLEKAVDYTAKRQQDARDRETWEAQKKTLETELHAWKQFQEYVTLNPGKAAAIQRVLLEQDEPTATDGSVPLPKPAARESRQSRREIDDSLDDVDDILGTGEEGTLGKKVSEIGEKVDRLIARWEQEDKGKAESEQRQQIEQLRGSLATALKADPVLRALHESDPDLAVDLLALRMHKEQDSSPAVSAKLLSGSMSRAFEKVRGEYLAGKRESAEANAETPDVGVPHAPATYQPGPNDLKMGKVGAHVLAFLQSHAKES